MSKKHFEALAAALKQSVIAYHGNSCCVIFDSILISELCRCLRASNPLFDERRFLEAAGLDSAALERLPDIPPPVVTMDDLAGAVRVGLVESRERFNRKLEGIG